MERMFWVICMALSVSLFTGCKADARGDTDTNTATDTNTTQPDTNAATDTSTAQDTTPGCGNGTVEPGEDCDDGNTNNQDGCSASCKYEPFKLVTTGGSGNRCELAAGPGYNDYAILQSHVGMNERLVYFDCDGGGSLFAMDPHPDEPDAFVFFTIEGPCALEWGFFGDELSDTTLIDIASFERVVKVNCAGGADPIFIASSPNPGIQTDDGAPPRCGLQWGSFGTNLASVEGAIVDTDHTAKWDCDGDMDTVEIEFQ